MFIEDSKLWRQEKAKQELCKRILDKTYYLDWRHGCDNGCNNSYTCFQIELPEGGMSEDSYCLDCLYKDVFKEMFPTNFEEEIDD